MSMLSRDFLMLVGFGTKTQRFGLLRYQCSTQHFHLLPRVVIRSNLQGGTQVFQGRTRACRSPVSSWQRLDFRLGT